MLKNYYRTVFLADDDPEDQEIFIEAIKTIDDTVQFLTATNGVIALKVLQGDVVQKPDLIFLDLNMPLLNGKQLLAELKKIETLRTIPVIMYSTFFGKKDIDELNKLGMAHHMIKPTRFESLQSSLKYILSKKW